jgi:TRAP-type uncharacterized transport system fused permease subunit
MNPTSFAARVFTVVALGLVVFQLYTAASAPLSAIFQRSAHLTLVLVLVFLVKPVHPRAHPALRWALDGGLIALSLAAGGYLFFNYDAIIERMGWYEPQDIAFGVSLSGGYLLPALVLVALASLVLGMGLPVTAAYIVLVVLAGPALQDLGVVLITAHMVVFWLSQDSNVTPPVALAAYAAAGIAGASPMRSGFQAWKFAKAAHRRGRGGCRRAGRQRDASTPAASHHRRVRVIAARYCADFHSAPSDSGSMPASADRKRTDAR